MKRAQVIGIAVLVAVVVVLAFVVGSRSGDDGAGSGLDITSADDETEFEHEYVIPAGTAARIEAGEQIAIVPAELVVQVGEAIRIVNEDDADHVVGVFFVAAGESLTQRFNSVAVLEGECSVHPSGSFRLRVVEGEDGA